MNVLFATITDPSGTSGQNMYAAEIAAAFGRAPSVSLLLVCPEPAKKTLSELGIHVEKVRYLPKRIRRQLRWHIMAQLYMFRALRSLILKNKPDAIVASLKVSLVVPALLAKWYRIPYILLNEGMGVRNVKQMNPFPGAHHLAKLVALLNARVAQQVYAAYEEAGQWIESYRTSTQTGVRIFHHAVNPDLFRPTPISIARQRLKLPLQDSDFVVGFVGGFQPYHCLIPLVQAIAEIRKRNDKTKLLAVGEGPEFEKVTAIVHEKEDLEKSVILTGFVPHSDVPLFISACDVLYGVIASNHWGSPMKCYEYLACERPIIVTATNEFSFVRERNIGRVIESVTVGGIVGAIDELYHIGSDQRQAMGKLGRESVIRHTWGHLINLILEEAQ